MLAPARLARAGEIGLVATPGGFGTPPLPDGTVLRVDGTRLHDGERSSAITTVRDAAAFVGIPLSATPDVGRDLPPFEPDAPLAVDDVAARSLAQWFALAHDVLGRLAVPGASITAPTLWPEHFDLAVVVTLPGDVGVNVGFSPGDAASDEPYAYVGPWERDGLTGDFWNAPFGALRPRSALDDPDAFVRRGLDLVRARGAA